MSETDEDLQRDEGRPAGETGGAEGAPPRRRRAARRPAAGAEPPPDADPATGTAADAKTKTDTEADAEPVTAPRRRRAVKAAPAASFTHPDGTDPAAGADADAGEPAAPARKRVRRAPTVPAFQAVDPEVVASARASAAGHAASADAEEDDGGAPDGGTDGEDGGSGPRRRRRGRRGRGRGRGDGAGGGGDSDSADAEPSGDGPAHEDKATTGSGGGEDGEDAAASTRRRRRRRRSGGSDGDEPSADDPPNTVVKVREPRSKKADTDGVRGLSGSTRLEAKRQRRREGRGSSRRAPIVTEAEYLARREAVERRMVVRNQGERTQIAVLEDGVLVEHYVTRATTTAYAGNVYLGKVQNVLPSMEAAFVDIGKGRNAVLYAGEVNYETAGLEGNRPHSIQEALKSGQNVLVQVTKDPIGQKGARLTSQITLPGRYLVYVPEGSMTGISRKLPDTERARLKAILKRIVPDDAGVIIRTAAEGASEDELARDVERLQQQWESIQKAAKKAEKKAPAVVHAEPDLVVRVVRDVFNEDFAELVVQGRDEWETIEAYVSGVAPDLLPRVSRWTDETDVFAANRVDEQLVRALDRKVHLPSGGSLVIDRTEAMTVIDVNTGRFTGKGGNLEETVTRNNLEAAEEIVRQLRLRDVGGIVVIDFIDMVLESNRELVLRRLTECLGRDRTRHQVAEVTSLGLVQMTRKRVGTGLLEAYSEPCLACQGRGVIIHMDGPPARAHQQHLPAATPRPRPPVPRPPSVPAAEPDGAGAVDVAVDAVADAAAVTDTAPAAADAEVPPAKPAPRRRRRATTGGPVSAEPVP